LRLNNALKTQSEKHSDKITAEFYKVRRDINPRNAKLITAQENNFKLREKNEKLCKEKSELVTQLIRLQVNSETLDSCFIM